MKKEAFQKSQLKQSRGELYELYEETAKKNKRMKEIDGIIEPKELLNFKIKN